MITNVKLLSMTRFHKQLMFSFLAALNQMIEQFSDVILIDNQSLENYISNSKSYISNPSGPYEFKNGILILSPYSSIEFTVDLNSEVGYVPTKVLVAISPEKENNNIRYGAKFPSDADITETNELNYVILTNTNSESSITILIENNSEYDAHILSIGIMTKQVKNEKW